MKNWKTTMTGLLLIIGGVTRLGFAIASGEFTEEAITTSASTILTGVGLIFAKDFNVTGGNIAQTQEAENRTGK